MVSSWLICMEMACFSQYHHGPSMTDTVPRLVATGISVCCPSPRCGGARAVPDRVVIVLTSKPAATFNPLGEPFESLPQKADASWHQSHKKTTRNKMVCRLIVPFLDWWPGWVAAPCRALEQDCYGAVVGTVVVVRPEPS